MRSGAARWASGFVALMAAALTHADELNMTRGVTAISREVYDLHMLIFWICVAIGVVVFGAMFVSIMLHRKSVGHVPAQFHENTTAEIAWTVVPIFILVGMAIPSTQVLVKMYDTGGEDVLIEVRGYQWKWQYKYLDQDLDEQVSFFSNLRTPKEEIHGQVNKGEHYLLEVDNMLYIPTGKKVRFLLTSADVIHAWWVPDFGIKRDAIPGIVNELWTIVDEPGIYRGQCTELCGKDHGFMPVVVNAVPQEEYDQWYAQKLEQAAAERELTSKEWTAEELYSRGEQVYGTFCASCHQANGQGLPPVFPALVGSAIATGPKHDHLDIVINGKAGTAMQAFGVQLNPVDLAAVVHYERHAWGNDAGDVTTPIEVLQFGQ